MYGTSSSTKTDATGHFELKTPKDASLQISRGEKVLFRTKAAKDIKSYWINNLGINILNKMVIQRPYYLY